MSDRPLGTEKVNFETIIQDMQSFNLVSLKT